MEHPYLFFVKLFEAVGLGHFAHAYPHVIYSWVVMAILIISGALAAKGIRMIPSGGQNFFEILITGIEDFMVDITGEEGRWLFPIIATVFIYIFTCNLIGLVPGFFPPTASLNTTLSCALTVVVFTHVIGIKYHGAKYIKHFMGPVWWMVPIIFPIEVIGHLARILSLSFRLFGNMMGHELVLAILFSLAGLFFAPLPIMGLGIFVALVQAFVFFLLSIMYFTGAMEHAH
ncbi:MAG: F0F1 ATP synthase subunit A [Deltaproteobacteria bacterium]|nr:F0F1 ATP synthase subunit A [Deltaproteobacteria bacterium]MBW1954844.1 F0F1 ATP synthase subunit A [Deltaproteobacteria bacterium]MBW2041919.1 F0F1 ATP synthase subunit A [Deltaproteobacteria bacterium]MBW2132827.1 F0F1 ATP synthase subunit A [Deltaproteobacteria bacterium]